MAHNLKWWLRSPMAKTLGERIRIARKRARLTQRALGELCNVSAPAVTLWESDKTTPSTGHLVAVARTANVSMQWLLFGHLSEQQENNTVPVWVRELRTVPMLSFSEALLGASDASNTAMVAVHFPCGNRSFAYTLDDESNAELYPTKTRWIIDPDRTPVPGDFVLAAQGTAPSPVCGEYSQEMTPSGRVTIITPRNKKWAAARSDIEQISIVGVMTEATIRGR